MQGKRVFGKDRICDACFFVLLGVLGYLLFLKCRYGFANLDESFYLETTFRVWQGDAMLSDEWSLAQLSAFLTLPIVSLYMRVAQGSTEGILLHFRYIYICVLLLSSVFVYLRCRRMSRWGALYGALLLLLYTPYAITALSYNSLGVVLSVLAMVCFLDTGARASKVWRILSGCFFAGAVICCPYLAFMYALFTLASVLPKKERGARLQAWLWFTVGVAIVAAVFVLFILSRATLAEIRECLPYMLDDDVHGRSTLFKRIGDYFTFIYTFYNRRQKATLVLLLVVYVVLLLDRDRIRHRAVYLAVAAPIFLYLMYYCAVVNCYVNFTVMPLFYFGPLAYALTDGSRAKARPIMRGIYPYGILYSFLVTCTSENQIYVVSSTLIVSSFATVLLFGILLEEMLAETVLPGWNRVVRGVGALSVCGILAIQLTGLAYARYQHIFWEPSGMAGQTEIIEEGIERGILVTPEKKAQYAVVTGVARRLREIADGRDDLTLLVAGAQPGLYLMCDQYACGSYCAWQYDTTRSDGAKVAGKFATYYRIHPEKAPDCIWTDGTAAEAVAWLDETYGYEETQVGYGALFVRVGLQ